MTPLAHPLPPLPQEEASAPWYRHPLVWMVIAGPAIVVVAGFVTLYLALKMPDPVTDRDYYRKGLNINRMLKDRGQLPAEMGRNHAMTPAEDAPAEGR